MHSQVGKPRWGHFVCSILTSKHEVCEQDQEKLYNSTSGELDTICKRCSTPIHAKINAKNLEEYFVTKSI